MKTTNLGQLEINDNLKCMNKHLNRVDFIEIVS